jgi:hypothetical protein
MKQTVQKSNNRQKTAAVKSTAQQKKLLIAVGLLFVMAVLWMRVFMNKGGPKTAVAITEAIAAGTAAESAAPKIEYIELPVIAGRHNVLSYDFFAASKLDNEVNMSGAADQQLSGDLAAAAEQLELTAIVNDKKPQVFFNIGDRLFEKGQSFKFMFRGQAYVFKVVNILDNKVELECNGVTITKKIPDILLKTE